MLTISKKDDRGGNPKDRFQDHLVLGIKDL